MQVNETKNWAIIQGDALKVLEGFAPGTFDAVITEIKTQNLIQSAAA